MKIVIMGTGGVGGYYGGLLARSGQEVHFIARGAHLKAIRESGLQIKSLHGDFLIQPAHATDHPAETGSADLVLFTTKAYQLDDAIEAVRPALGPDTIILPLLNGVDAAERVGSALGMSRLLGGATWVSAAIEKPGVIGQYSSFRRIVIGELDGKMTQRLEAVRQALERTGATVEVSDDISKVLWTKFVFISSISAMGALTRVTIGDYRSVEETHSIMKKAVEEVAAVAAAKGVRLASDVTEQTLSLIEKSDHAIKPSMQRDIEAGRVSELESMIGVVVRFGRELGVPTPVMSFAYSALKPVQRIALAKASHVRA